MHSPLAAHRPTPRRLARVGSLCAALTLSACAWDAPREARFGSLDLGVAGDATPRADRGAPLPCALPVTEIAPGPEGALADLTPGLRPLPNAACGEAGPQALFSFTAPSAGTWRFDSAESVSDDTTVSVLDGCRADARQLICNNDLTDRAWARLDLRLAAGEQVYVVVAPTVPDARAPVRLTVRPVTGGAEGEPCDVDDPGACDDGLACWWARGALTVCQRPRPRALGEACAEDGRIGPCVDGVCRGEGPDAQCQPTAQCPPSVFPSELAPFQVDGDRWEVSQVPLGEGEWQPACLSGAPRAHSIWRLEVPSAGLYVARTSQPPRAPQVDTVLALSTQCDTGEWLACDDDSGRSTYSEGQARLSAGETLFIQVSPFSAGEVGIFDLVVERR